MCCKKHFDILSGRVEACRKIGGHDCGAVALKLLAIYGREIRGWKFYNAESSILKFKLYLQIKIESVRFTAKI